MFGSLVGFLGILPEGLVLVSYAQALEKWPVEMMERMLPRHLQIIYQINGIWIQKLLQRPQPIAITYVALGGLTGV